MLGTRGRHGADQRAIVGISDLDHVVGGDELAGDAHRFAARGAQ